MGHCMLSCNDQIQDSNFVTERRKIPNLPGDDNSNFHESGQYHVNYPDLIFSHHKKKKNGKETRKKLNNQPFPVCDKIKIKEPLFLFH